MVSSHSTVDTHAEVGLHRSDADDRMAGSRGGTALLLDFDGTLCPVDVTAEILPALGRPGWREALRAARDDRSGSRALQEAMIPFLPADRAQLMAFALSHDLDPAARPLVDAATAGGWTVEVVSDGLGFYIPTMLERAGIRVAIRAADLRHDGESLGLVAPWAGRRSGVCPGCTTCKVEAIADHHAAGRRVVLVGDGRSDQLAARFADVTYATGPLAEHCSREGIPFRAWRRLGEVQADLVRRGELDDDRALGRAPGPRPGADARPVADPTPASDREVVGS